MSNPIGTTQCIILTWNVRGLGDPRKRRRILSYLDKHHVTIAMLQETHIHSLTPSTFATKWAAYRIFSSYSSYARGTAILIKKGTPFLLTGNLTDPQGRYVILWGRLGGDSITLANCYGPNIDTPEFFTVLWGKVMALGSTHIVWGGDFNVALNPCMDRSRATMHHYSRAQNALAGIMEEGALIDGWRHIHLQIREATHYTTHADSWARIDYILLTRGLLHSLDSVVHLPRTYSDHCPVKLTISPPGYDKPRPRWRLQPTMLSDAVFHEELGTEIQAYFTLNRDSVREVATIWEAFKATIRGVCISKGFGVLRDLQNTLKKLERELRQLEVRMIGETMGPVHNEFRAKLTEFEETAARETKFRGRHWVARRFGEGERPGRALAEVTRNPRFSNSILEIEGPDKVPRRDSRGILDAFTEHYRTLYTSQRQELPDLDEFLEGVRLQYLTDTQREFLSAPFELDEIREAIMKMQSGKAPGLDGIPIDFYKHYIDIMAPVLKEIFEDSLEMGVLPPSMREALVTSLLKPGKNPVYCDSYRPLSLLNSDTKILAKVLANRLTLILDQLVLPDQSGFVPGRSTANNLRTLFSLLQNVAPDCPLAAVFLDATKVFDSVEWDYLIDIMGRMGFPRGFISWIRLLYQTPEIVILINGYLSSAVPISRGTRQGCPLSPLLFALVMEPLAAKLRRRHRDKAFVCYQRQILVSLYADDITLYVKDPQSNINALLREFITFGRLSGVNINWGKSQLFPLTAAVSKFAMDFPLEWCDSDLRYLGIQLTRNREDTLRLNYGTAITQLTSNITCWISLPLSMAGRVSLIKRVVLPRFLYLFTNIPYDPGRPFFQSLRSELARLVWGGRQPRLQWVTLTRPYDQGGMDIPDFMLYYLCAQAQFAFYWFFPPQFSPQVAVEQWLAHPLPLEGILLAPRRKRTEPPTTVSSTVEAWHHITKRLEAPVFYSPLLPLSYHPAMPLLQEAGFQKLCKRLGILTWGALFQSGTFVTKDQFARGGSLSPLDLFLYVRLRQGLHSSLPDFPKEPASLVPLHQLLATPDQKHLVSRLYHTIHTLTPRSVNSARDRWSTDLGLDISDDQWQYCCRQTALISASCRFRIIHYKYLQQLYYTPAKKFRFRLSDNDCCERCRRPGADFLHLAWGCPRIQEFWEQVIAALGHMTGITLGADPLVALLGYTANIPQLFANTQR